MSRIKYNTVYEHKNTISILACIIFPNIHVIILLYEKKYMMKNTIINYDQRDNYIIIYAYYFISPWKTDNNQFILQKRKNTKRHQNHELLVPKVEKGSCSNIWNKLKMLNLHFWSLLVLSTKCVVLFWHDYDTVYYLTSYTFLGLWLVYVEIVYIPN